MADNVSVLLKWRRATSEQRVDSNPCSRKCGKAASHQTSKQTGKGRREKVQPGFALLYFTAGAPTRNKHQPASEGLYSSLGYPGAAQASSYWAHTEQTGWFPGRAEGTSRTVLNTGQVTVARDKSYLPWAVLLSIYWLLSNMRVM